MGACICGTGVLSNEKGTEVGCAGLVVSPPKISNSMILFCSVLDWFV